MVKVVTCTGIKINAANTSVISIYPNPAAGAFNIKSGETIDLTIINEQGQAVRYLKLNAANDYHITIDGLSAGVYFVTYQDHGTIVSQKIVITR